MANSGLRHIDVGPELTRSEWESEQTHALINGTSFPAAPVERQLFYRNDLHEWYIYDGSAWVSLQATAPMAVHDNAYHNPDMATEANLDAHTGAEAAPVHGSTSLATADKLVHRNAHGRARVVDPDVDADIDTRGARNQGIEDHRLGGVHGLDQPPQDHDNAKHTTNYAAEADLTAHEGEEAAGVHGSTSAATAEKLIHRDNQGRARVAPPSHNDDIDTQGCRDTAIDVHKAWQVHDQDQPPAAHDNTKHTTNYAPLANFNTHAARHEHGGMDEVGVAGLSGELTDDQPPKDHDNAKHTPNFEEEGVAATQIATHAALADAHHAEDHAARHQAAGADQLSVAGLSGELADDQPPQDHDNAKHSTDYAAESAFDNHSARHQDGGADEISIAGLAGESAELATHKGVEAAGVHGSTAAATADKLVHRDSNARAKVAAPSATDDIARLEETTKVRAVDAKTANYTLVLADAGKLITMSNSADRTITIPTNANEAFPIGTKIAVVNLNEGKVTIGASGGVTRRSFDDAYDLAGQYAGAVLIKIDTDTWLIEGNVDTL